MSENKQVANETNTRPQEGSVQLPFELIMMIFSWLLPREAFRIARVSRPFKDYVYSSEYARMALKLVVNKADLIASFLNIPSPQFHEAIALTCMQDVQAIDFQLLNHPISNVYVPAALGLVKNATTLNLARSSFIGPIPKEICQLDRLTYLNLTYNDLNGPIPSELGNLVYLTTLNLYNNRIVGLIPKEIGHLNRLKYLNLACNDLKGPIPAELGSLINLETLNFGNNPTLSGTLPPEFGRLVNLSELKLPYTSIKGPIPSEYGQLENLRLMDLSHTNLNCKIPPELGQLKSLVELHLNNCGLYGKIPNNLSKLDKLGYMYLQDNRLEGCVPAGFYDRKFSSSPGVNVGGLPATNFAKIIVMTTFTQFTIPRHNDLSELSDSELDKIVGYTTDISRQIHAIALPFIVGLGIMLGIPEFQPCFQPVFLFAFSTLTIAAYLRCQQPLFLLGTPLYFLFLIYNDPTYETALLSFHARFNACIIASAVIMNQSKRWRNSPTVKVAATIITEDAFSNTLVLSMSVMSYFVQRTATSLAMIPYPLQVVIQVVCAAFSLTLFYALVELALSQMAKFCFGIEFQKYRTTDNVVVLWRKVCAWHEKLSRENVSGNVQRLEDGKERKD